MPFVQGKGGNTVQGTPFPVAFDSPNTAGNFLVALTDYTIQTTTLPVTDSQGNTWIPYTKVSWSSGGGRWSQVWYCENCKAGANTVTVTPIAVTAIQLVIAEYSGIALSSSPDGTIVNAIGGVNTTYASGNLTTSNANDLLIGLVINNLGSSYTPAGGFASRQTSGNALLLVDQIVSSTGTYNNTGTLSSGAFWVAQIAAFKAARVATPTFAPVAGSYSGTQSVAISSTDSGLTGFAITYTTDGSTPVPGSHGTVYSGPVTVASSLTLKAVASATGFSNSNVGSADYTITALPGGTDLGLNSDFLM